MTNLIVNQLLLRSARQITCRPIEAISEAITADEVQRVANYVRPQEMAMVIVGDAEEIIPSGAAVRRIDRDLRHGREFRSVVGSGSGDKLNYRKRRP